LGFQGFAIAPPLYRLSKLFALGQGLYVSACASDHRPPHRTSCILRAFLPSAPLLTSPPSPLSPRPSRRTVDGSCRLQAFEPDVVCLLYAVYYGLDRGAELVTSASVGAT